MAVILGRVEREDSYHPLMHGTGRKRKNLKVKADLDHSRTLKPSVLQSTSIDAFIGNACLWSIASQVVIQRFERKNEQMSIRSGRQAFNQSSRQQQQADCSSLFVEAEKKRSSNKTSISRRRFYFPTIDRIYSNPKGIYWSWFNTLGLSSNPQASDINRSVAIWKKKFKTSEVGERSQSRTSPAM